MKSIIKIGFFLFFLPICTQCLLSQTNDFVNFARSHGLSEKQLLTILTDSGARSNFLAEYHSPDELSQLKRAARYLLENPTVQSNYFKQLHDEVTDYEIISKAASNMVRSASSPDEAAKLMLKNSEKILRSAISTNELEQACAKMTNQPASVAVLRSISNQAKSYLDGFAASLLDSNLKMYGNNAEIHSSKADEGNIYFLFWSKDGPIRDIDMRTKDNQHVIVNARFYKSGKLEEFRINSQKNDGSFQTSKILNFNEDGSLKSFWNRSGE